MKQMEKADVVICGAGSAGVAAAYYLIQQGITDVLLVDNHPPLSQTSAKSGENYRNWWPTAVMVDFMNHSIDLMESLTEATNNAFNLEKRGYLYVTGKPEVTLQDYLAHYRQFNVGDIRPHHHENGQTAYQPNPNGATVGADILSEGPLIRQHFPHLAESIQTAVHVRRAGSISAQQLGMYLLEQAKQGGARLLTGSVKAIERDGQGVKAVEVMTDAGAERIETRVFINAAGPFAPTIAALLGLELPVFSVLQQKIALQDGHGIIPRNAPFTIFMDEQPLDWGDDEAGLRADPEFAWLLDPFPGGLHVKPEGGEDSTWVRLGWAINQAVDQPSWEPDITPEFPELVVRGAAQFIPELNRYIGNLPTPVVHYAGYYTKTEENLPLIGPMEVKGSYILGALSGFGTMASCAAGELIAAWVADNQLPDYGQALSLARYASPDIMQTMRLANQNGEL